MTTGVVTLTRIRKEFPTAKGTFVAVNDIDLETTPGEFLGPSGCGKPPRCAWWPASRPRTAAPSRLTAWT